MSQLVGRKLTKNEVHIWLACLDEPVDKFQQLLAADEQERAARFHFERDRNRFIIRRGILRMLLGCYSGIEPEKLLFSYGENGKPGLASELNREGLHFNLSHSDGMAIYAFSTDNKIGVDIEHIRNITDMEKLVGRFFSHQEKMMFSELPASQKKEGFFNCWTRKEAFIKATGNGLSMSLDKFDVSLAPDEPARLLGIDGDAKAASAWTLQSLRPFSGFTAALAVGGKVDNISYWQWQN